MYQNSITYNTMLEFYPIQASIISQTRIAIKASKSICIDSPTGTGKTRIILLSILPFLDPTKTNIGSSAPITLNNLEHILSSEINKVFYVSRTHSQLNQVLEEIRNINILHSKNNTDKLININAVVLGNRQLYCSVYEGDIEDINMKCKNGECEYKEKKKFHKGTTTDFTGYVTTLYDFINKEEIEPINEEGDFGMDSFFKIPVKKRYLLDIKTLNSLAAIKNKQNLKNMTLNNKENTKRTREEILENSSNFCPFYFTKHFVNSCPLTFLTYNSILNIFSRESYKLNVDDSILVFDEAHNLFDMLINQNTSEISYFKLTRLHIQMKNSKFKESTQRISNQQEFKKLTLLLGNILKIQEIYLNGFLTSKAESLNAFIKMKNKENQFHLNYDEFPLILSVSVTEFQKIVDILEFNTFPLVEFIQNTTYFRDQIEPSLIDFLRLLTDSNSNCRIHITFNSEDSKKEKLCKIKTIKLFPLEPSIYFKPFTKAKSIIFTGGTMEPHTLLNTLLPDIQLIKGEPVCTNFLPFICTHNKQTELKLTYTNRDTLIPIIKSSLEELLNLKGNAIVFFTSKDILKSFETIKTSKTVFLDDFEKYNKFIEDSKSSNNGTDGVLFSVLGGSLSEGINFGDDLCRILIIVGVPFPNPDLALYERQQFYKEKNIDIMKCIAFKSVNQALGRAIRHKKDWASMILIDSRYVKDMDSIVGWIGDKLQIGNVEECKIKVQNFIDQNIKN